MTVLNGLQPRVRHEEGDIIRQGETELPCAEQFVAVDGCYGIADAGQCLLAYLAVKTAAPRPGGHVISVPPYTQLGIVIKERGELHAQYPATEVVAINQEAVLIVRSSRIRRLRDRKIQQSIMRAAHHPAIRMPIVEDDLIGIFPHCVAIPRQGRPKGAGANRAVDEVARLVINRQRQVDDLHIVVWTHGATVIGGPAGDIVHVFFANWIAARFIATQSFEAHDGWRHKAWVRKAENAYGRRRFDGKWQECQERGRSAKTAAHGTEFDRDFMVLC